MKRGLFALDIDGVLTDGAVSVNAVGDERKLLSYRDIDAVFRARREGLTVALLTAEDTPVAKRIADRLAVDHFISGCDDKAAALRGLVEQLSIPADRSCFIGDSAKDVGALGFAGLGLVPADAESAAVTASDRVLTFPGGRGAVAEGLMLFLARLEPSASSRPRETTSEVDAERIFLHDLVTVLGDFESTGLEIVAGAGDLLRRTLEHGGTILTFGNGGSAADAQHFATEIVGSFRGLPGAGRAIALTADSALLTAAANDAGYDAVFSSQVEVLGRPGDVAVAFTTSGRSENVRRGLAAARNNDIATILVTGAGAPRGIDADFRIVVPSTDTQRIQEVHGLVTHMLCARARERE